MTEVLVQYPGPSVPLEGVCVACSAEGPLERDHCHKHGWIRGIVCGPCNRHLIRIDRHLAPRVDAELLAALLAVRNRCTDCDQLDLADLAAIESPEPRRRGTPELFRRIRLNDDLWERLEQAAREADPDSNRSALIRRFARWFVGDIDDLPQRPAPKRGPRGRG